MPKKRKISGKSLNSQIKTEVLPALDSIDPHVGDHLLEVIKNFKSLGPLEKISLLTPDDAKNALKTLDATQAKIDRQLKAISALKRLLQQQ